MTSPRAFKSLRFIAGFARDNETPRPADVTSFRSWRHSSTARLLFHECLGHSRVRSSLHTPSSANFQPAERLRGGEAAAPGFLSAAATGILSAAGPGPPAGFCGLSAFGASLAIALFCPRVGRSDEKTQIKSSRRGTRIQSAIFTEPVSLLLRSGAVGGNKMEDDGRRTQPIREPNESENPMNQRTQRVITRVREPNKSENPTNQRTQRVTEPNELENPTSQRTQQVRELNELENPTCQNPTS
ncbi:hypothetical protein EYF80_051094 [Liparis tanakae]|uniref:Uncharacterized protein n=1 Tax=Liparis tanakae TaxID=230148 RepID=A0A4Z2FC44_9TELE|nr:hypothetical protein EYF80_051094 [Liparis tanakae]